MGLNFSQRKGPLPKKAVVVIALLFIGIGCFMLYLAAKDAYEELYVSKRMKPIEVVIQSSGIRTNRSSKSVSHSFVVSYTYRIDGIEYVGDKYKLGIGQTEKYSECERLTRLYERDSRHRGFYDPENPTFSVLSIVPDGTYWIFGGLGILFFIIMIVFIKVSKRVRIRAKEALTKTVERITTPKPQGNPYMATFLAVPFIGFAVALFVMADNTITTGGYVFLGIFSLIGVIFGVSAIIRIPGYRKMKNTSIAYDRTDYLPGDQVQFVIMSRNEMLEEDKLKVFLGEKSVGSKGQDMFEDLFSISIRQAEVEGMQGFAGSFVIPEDILDQVVLKGKLDVIPNLVVNVTYGRGKLYYDFPFKYEGISEPE